MSRKALNLTIGGLALALAAPASLLAQRISPGSQGGANAPIIALVAAGRVKDLYLVDVYAQGAPDLRSYQVTVSVSGGSAGTLELANVLINRQRADYVFGQDQVVTAESTVSSKVAAVAFDGGVKVNDWAYLGTFLFRPSKNAAGEFAVSIQATGDTLLANSNNEEVPFVVGPAARLKLDTRTSTIRSAATNK